MLSSTRVEKIKNKKKIKGHYRTTPNYFLQAQASVGIHIWHTAAAAGGEKIQDLELGASQPHGMYHLVCNKFKKGYGKPSLKWSQRTMG